MMVHTARPAPPPAPFRMRALARLALAGLIAAGGCTSAAKRLERAERHGYEGRWADAVSEYIEVLRKERDHAAAREQLRLAGDSMVADALRRSAADESAGRAAAGADLLLRSDALRGRAAQVGVHIALPDDYEAYRRRLLDGAIAELHQLAQSDVAAGQWGRALGRYERIGEHYLPDERQRARSDSARFATHLLWAEAEAQRGRFRAAHDRVGQALAIAGRERHELSRAAQLQAGYVERGTRTVAFLPLRADEAAGRQLPEDLLPSLNDALVFEEWTRTPPFLAAVPAAELNRELRRLGHTRGVIAGVDAARLGRELRADLVVSLEADTLRRSERDVRATRRAVRTRAGADTAFTIEQGRADVELAVRYAIVDPSSRRVVDQGRVRARVTADFRRPRYAGDYRDLDLTRADLELFRRDERAEDDRALVRRLTDEAAPRLARELWERLLSRVE